MIQNDGLMQVDIDGVLRGRIRLTDRQKASWVELAVGPRLLGIAPLEIVADDEFASFAAPVVVDTRAAVTVRLMPDEVEVPGSPIVVEYSSAQRLPVPISDVEFIEVKRLALDHGVELALFVTHTRTGALKPHVTAYLRALKAEKIAVILIVVADSTVSLHSEALALVAGAIVRRNSGYDFGAWAHCLRIYPEVFGAPSLYLINDSMFAPSRGEAFSQMIERIRQREADLIGLTQNLEYQWHLQSFFLVLRPRLLSSGALHAFLDAIQPLEDKDDVVKAYELRFSPMMQAAGFKTEAIFTSDLAGNPTLNTWRTLLKQGFPFVKVLLVAGAHAHVDMIGWRDALDAAGFDLNMVDATILAGREVLRLEQSDRLLAHPLPATTTAATDARISYFGSWNMLGPAGCKARAVVEALRRLGGPLSLHPVATSAMPDLGGFVGVPDLAVINLEAIVTGELNLDAEQRVIAARRRVGLLEVVDARIIQGGFCDELWTTRPDVAEAALRLGGTPVVVIPELDPIDGGIMLAATNVATSDIRRRIAELLASPCLPRRLVRPAVDLGLGIPVARADFGPFLCMVVLDVDSRAAEEADAADAAWIGLAPADALLAPSLAMILADHALRRPDAALFYADDLALETEFPADRLRLKPDFDLTLLGSQDYIGAPVFVRRDAWDRLGGLRTEPGTAAVIDLLFRAHGEGLTVCRIPEVLLAHPGPRRRALDEDFRRVLDAQPRPVAQQIVPGRVPGSWLRLAAFQPADDAPAVTLIIPTARAVDVATGRPLIEGLLECIAMTDWPMDRLEILIGDDEADEPDWTNRRWPFKLRTIAMPRGRASFNFATKMNALWREASTEQLVLLNDDVRGSDPHWLAALQAHAIDPTVGAVGARLMFPDGRLQHAGMAPSVDSAMHLWAGRREQRGTCQDWALVAREWSMVTGAVLATRRSLLLEMGGFDESLPLEFNDTDLCLRLRTSGYRIIYQPAAEFVHHERASRGDMPVPGDSLARFRQRWRAWLDQDPSWHPHLRRDQPELQPALDPAAWYADRGPPVEFAL